MLIISNLNLISVQTWTYLGMRESQVALCSFHYSALCTLSFCSILHLLITCDRLVTRLVNLTRATHSLQYFKGLTIIFCGSLKELWFFKNTSCRTQEFAKRNIPIVKSYFLECGT